jgi:PhnB protein
MAKLKRPEGHHTVTPGFVVPNAAKIVTFLEKVFDGKVVDRYDGPGGAIMHCEVRLGDSVVMLGDPSPEMGPMPASLTYYVDDGDAVDATFKKALAAGAKSLREPANQFYGYRVAMVQDPGGNKWSICAVVEQLTKEEILHRMEKLAKG